MRVVVTSDLHYDLEGRLTPPEVIEALAAQIAAERPRAVVLAGDIADGLAPFEACLRCFRGIDAPVAVLPGNHDLWRDEEGGHSSEDLFTRLLPEAARRQGVLWLEGENLYLGGVAIVGSMVWYDYSAVDPWLEVSPDEIAAEKPKLSGDAAWLDWDREDRAFAAELGAALLGRLSEAAADPAVRAILVVTHVPILEEQLTRHPQNPRWGLSNAFFGNLSLGRELLREPKLRAVVSGHTHFGRRATVLREGMPAVEARVIAADYGAPGYLCVEL